MQCSLFSCPSLTMATIPNVTQTFGATTTLNPFTSPSHRRSPLKCGHSCLANKVAILGREYWTLWVSGSWLNILVLRWITGSLYM